MWQQLITYLLTRKMAVTLGPNGILLPGDSNPQRQPEGIVKVGITSSPSNDFSAGNGFGPQWQYSGAEVSTVSYTHLTLPTKRIV